VVETWPYLDFQTSQFPPGPWAFCRRRASISICPRGNATLLVWADPSPTLRILDNLEDNKLWILDAKEMTLPTFADPWWWPTQWTRRRFLWQQRMPHHHLPSGFEAILRLRTQSIVAQNTTHVHAESSYAKGTGTKSHRDDRHLQIQSEQRVSIGVQNQLHDFLRWLHITLLQIWYVRRMIPFDDH